MRLYTFMAKASHPPFMLPGKGYVRSKPGDLLKVNEEQKNFLENPSFAYRDYFLYVNEEEVAG